MGFDRHKVLFVLGVVYSPPSSTAAGPNLAKRVPTSKIRSLNKTNTRRWSLLSSSIARYRVNVEVLLFNEEPTRQVVFHE